MIAPDRALRDVRASLRSVVMPELESDRARAVLGSTLGILDELAGRVQLDGAPARQTATELIAALPGWERQLDAAGSPAAARITGLRTAAEAALPADPLGARDGAMAAAEVATTAAWDELEEPDRGTLLSQIRELTRADVERQGGKR